MVLTSHLGFEIGDQGVSMTLCYLYSFHHTGVCSGGLTRSVSLHLVRRSPCYIIKSVDDDGGFCDFVCSPS